VISGIFAATGQTCIAGSRLLVQRKIHDAFVDKVVKFAGTARIGDPSKLETQVGPVTTRPQYDKVLRYIETAKSEGATCLLGGSPSRRPECGTGWFVEPTIFSGVTPEMQIAREEVFGPVLAVLPFEDDEEAVHIANSLPYGLAAGVWTENIGRALTMVNRLEAGTVWVNTYRAVSYMMPFGGYKRSGLGRENGMGMINEYLQTKSVWIDMGNDVPNPFVLR
jgi:aldehyde dehydrogenase (NAD+)